MGPEAAIFGAVMLFLLLGIIVKEITIDNDRKSFDKSND